MTANINRVLLSGNLTREPERRETASGTKILSFSVASNARRRTAEGEWEDAPNFVDCQLFGNRVDYFAERLEKGTKVFVDGELRYTTWEAKDGSGKRAKLEVICQNIDLIASVADDDEEELAPADIPF